MIQPTPHISCFPRKAMRGFTLLEVMLAISIFAICMVAIYTSFRTSAKAYESGRRSTEHMQTIRFTVDQLTRDLRSIYYETDYNVRFEELEQQALSQQDTLLNQLEDQQDSRDKSDEKEGEETGLPLGYAGAKSNLQFVGEDNGENDSIEFAHFLPTTGTDDESYQGAERIRYYLEGTDLYRQRSHVVDVMQLNPNLEEDIQKAREEGSDNDSILAEKKVGQKGLSQEELEKQYSGSNLFPFLLPKSKVRYYVPVQEEPDAPELLATNVKALDIKYGYFFEKWQEAEDWNSEGKTYRTPPFNLPPDDPDFMNKMLSYDVRPQDHLPTYVRIRLSIADSGEGKDSKRKGRASTIETIIWIPSSEETYVPTDSTYFEPNEEGDENGNPREPKQSGRTPRETMY